MIQLTQQDIEVLEVLASVLRIQHLIDLMNTLNLPHDSLARSIGKLIACGYIADAGAWRYAATSAGCAALATLQADTELDPLALLYAGMGGAA